MTARTSEPGTTVWGSGADVRTERPGLGLLSKARTTTAWAQRHGAPVESGTVRAMAYVLERRLLLLVPDGVSLLPSSGAWFDADDLEDVDA